MRNLLRKYPDFTDMRAALTAALWVEGKEGEAESQWVRMDDSRYMSMEWIRTTRRWPAPIADALERFLVLK